MLIPQERKILRELPTIYATFGLYYWGIYMGSDVYGNIPQWITALTAFLALTVASVSVLVQWSTARKRAAIDFFLKTDADAHMLAAYDKFWAGVAEMRKTPIKDFCTSKEEGIRKQYFAIRQYLNIHELVAVGIKNGMFDGDTCYDFWSGVLLRSVEEARTVIDYVRDRPGREETYQEMMRLYENWKAKEKREKKCVVEPIRSTT